MRRFQDKKGSKDDGEILFTEVWGALDLLVQLNGILTDQKDNSYKGTEKTSVQLLPIVKKMKKKFQKSYTNSQKLMGNVQKETEKIIEEIGTIRNDISKMQREKVKLSRQMTDDLQKLKIHDGELNECEKDQRKAKEKLDGAQEKIYKVEKRNETLGNAVGIVFGDIPVLGWVAKKTMKKIEKKANRHKQVVTDLENRLGAEEKKKESAQQSVRGSEKQIIKNEIRQEMLTDKQNELEVTLSSRKATQDATHDLKEKLQKCTTAAGSFHASATNTQTAVKYSLCLEQMVVATSNLMLTMTKYGAALPIGLQEKVALTQKKWTTIQQSTSLSVTEDW